MITSDMCFNEGFGEFVEENGLATRSSAYHVVSIIGGQSSGKSTILNHLFGTSFDMMNSKAGRQQTTKGIWCACAQGGEMLVLDVEGTDGREKEDQKEFEGKSALFSLALTDVMMVNMWMHEVGRFNAANLPLIRTVLEVHLKLLDHSGGAAPQASKPLLLFLLRDCDGETPVEQLQADVVRDIEKLWCDAHKPDGMSAAQLTDFFDLECIALPHFVYCKEQWKQDVAALSKRFLDASAEDYVFRGHSGKEVPAESFADYASQLWTDIEKDNDLDLPSQRKMLSIVRCERKRAQHLASFQHQCEADSWPDTATASNFKGEVQARLSALLDAYDQETKGYDADERDKAKALLATAFWERALDKFEALVRVERQAVEEEAAIALPNLLPQSGRLPERGFARKVEAECRRIRRQLLDKVDRFLPAGSPWRDSLNEPEGAATLLGILGMRDNSVCLGVSCSVACAACVETQTLQEADPLGCGGADKQLEREVADVNKEFGNIVIAFHQKSLKKSLDKELIRIIDTASPKMWVQIRQAHRAAIESQLDEMKEILEEVGRGADAIKEHRTLRKFADELVADRVANEAVKDNFERKMFAAFDALYNRHKNRSWRMWDRSPHPQTYASPRAPAVKSSACVCSARH